MAYEEIKLSEALARGGWYWLTGWIHYIGHPHIHFSTVVFIPVPADTPSISLWGEWVTPDALTQTRCWGPLQPPAGFYPALNNT